MIRSTMVTLICRPPQMDCQIVRLEDAVVRSLQTDDITCSRLVRTQTPVVPLIMLVTNIALGRVDSARSGFVKSPLKSVTCIVVIARRGADTTLWGVPGFVSVQ